MSIRSVVKALIVHDDQVLLVRRSGGRYGDCYALPGGGQAHYEAMEETLVRECLEETGYLVRPIKFLALYEEIREDDYLRKHYPDYTHQVYHVFLCGLESERSCPPTAEDYDQVGCEWVGIERLQDLNLQPVAIREIARANLEEQVPLFLGTIRS